MDKHFKTIIIILTVVFLVIYGFNTGMSLSFQKQISQNGHYQISTTQGAASIIDTRTGKVYVWNNGNWIQIKSLKK